MACTSTSARTGTIGPSVTPSCHLLNTGGPEGTKDLSGTDVYYLWSRKVDGKFVVTYKADTFKETARRCVGISQGKDFKHFSDTKIILRSDLLDPPDIQYHGMVGFPYADVYLGLAERWFGDPNHLR